MCVDVEARTQLYVDLLNYHLIFLHLGVGPLDVSGKLRCSCFACVSLFVCML